MPAHYHAGMAVLFRRRVNLVTVRKALVLLHQKGVWAAMREAPARTEALRLDSESYESQ